jgi:hypothetical protein
MALVVDFTCHVINGISKDSEMELARRVLPVPGSPFTNRGRLRVIAALTEANRASLAT